MKRVAEPEPWRSVNVAHPRRARVRGAAEQVACGRGASCQGCGVPKRRGPV